MSLDIKTVDSEEIEETAFFIAGHLNETKKIATKQIRKIVQVLGTEQALAYLQQTHEVEKAGGMLITSGKRRRTIGGVFFFLVRTKCDESTVKHIWPDKPEKKDKRQASTD